MDEERLRRVADVLSQSRRDMLVVDLAAAAQEKVAAGVDERTAVREAAMQLAAAGTAAPPDLAALDRAVAGSIPAGRLWAAAFSLVLSASLLLGFLLVTFRFKQIFDAVDVPMPGLTIVCFQLCDLALALWPVIVVAFAVDAWLLIRSLRRGVQWLGLRSVLLTVLIPVWVLALTLPLISLLQGIGKQK